MRAINLFLATRPSGEELFSEYESVLSGRSFLKRTRPHEAASLRGLVRNLPDLPVTSFGGFYFSWSIPQIEKEFDLLKFTADCSRILNIELKSQEIGPEKIEKQLRQNRYYLGHITKDITSFTYVEDASAVYTLDESGKLRPSDFRELADALRSFSVPCLQSGIESLFKVTNYLVAPLNEPERFLKGEYFLTRHQQDLKELILSDLTGDVSHVSAENAVSPGGKADDAASPKGAADDAGASRTVDAGAPAADPARFISLTGGPGTGKTLLLYDIARAYPGPGRVCLIHCGPILEGHRTLDRALEKADIISADALAAPSGELRSADGARLSGLRDYACIFVNEAQRIPGPLLAEILRAAEPENGPRCLFSFDPRQTLNASEVFLNASGTFLSLSGTHTYRLTKTIRAGQELSAFITALFDLKNAPPGRTYRNVDVLFARNREEAKAILEDLCDGFTFIRFTPSPYRQTRLDDYRGGCTVHESIGQGFDSVVMVMEDDFYYDEKGSLKAGSHPYHEYLFLNMLYQGLTRARERLRVIVCGDEALFARIHGIKAGSVLKE